MAARKSPRSVSASFRSQPPGQNHEGHEGVVVQDDGVVGTVHGHPSLRLCVEILTTTSLALLLATPALAATGDSLSLGHAAIRSVASLALVVALILIISVAARRWLGRVPAGGHRNPIQIVASRALGSRATITMLEVEGERLLVGSSPHGLGLICKLGTTDHEAAGDDRFDRLLADESVRGAR